MLSETNNKLKRLDKTFMYTHFKENIEFMMSYTLLSSTDVLSLLMFKGEYFLVN